MGTDELGEEGVTPSSKGVNVNVMVLNMLPSLQKSMTERNESLPDLDRAELLDHAILTLRTNVGNCNRHLTKVREIENDMVAKIISVKTTQQGGWRLQNPKFSLGSTVPRSIAKRHPKTTLSNTSYFQGNGNTFNHFCLALWPCCGAVV